MRLSIGNASVDKLEKFLKVLQMLQGPEVLSVISIKQRYMLYKRNFLQEGITFQMHTSSASYKLPNETDSLERLISLFN